MITDHQRTVRKIGSSDAAAVCGLSPYRSAWDLWATITGRVEPFAGNAATDAGNRLEEAVRSWAFDQIETHEIERDVSLVHEDYDWMTANLDSRIILASGERSIVEAKTAGITSPLRFEDWGDSGTGEIPEIYQLQVQHQMAVAGPEFRFAYVAALLPPRGFCLFTILRDDPLIDALIDRERDFWLNHVLANVEPDAAPSLDVAKRLRRTKDKEVCLELEIVNDWLTAKKHAAEWQKEVDRTQALLLAALGDAEIGVHAAGSVTYREQTTKAHSVQEKTYRVLRNKESK